MTIDQQPAPRVISPGIRSVRIGHEIRADVAWVDTSSTFFSESGAKQIERIPTEAPPPPKSAARSAAISPAAASPGSPEKTNPPPPRRRGRGRCRAVSACPSADLSVVSEVQCLSSRGNLSPYWRPQRTWILRNKFFKSGSRRRYSKTTRTT
ncbi:hypothetical protein GUJ93_ZPchr0002g24343 [Zizania palustris]|uniref:Uncharacterized protein n=1 Tax=Zizania palustris TaxID=103762 RepID=A0A8J5VBA8_ZIZPA|nr:hypothetical protein GUJ93_ZPchr0002g24343 [Zizania palustris]